MKVPSGSEVGTSVFYVQGNYWCRTTCQAMGYSAYINAKIKWDKIEVLNVQLLECYPTWYLADASRSTFFTPNPVPEHRVQSSISYISWECREFMHESSENYLACLLWVAFVWTIRTLEPAAFGMPTQALVRDDMSARHHHGRVLVCCLFFGYGTNED